MELCIIKSGYSKWKIVTVGYAEQLLEIEDREGDMIWNFSFCVVTIMVLVVLVLYFWKNPRLPVLLNDFFVALILVELGTLIIDVGSSMMDMNHKSFPVWSLYLANTAYFVFFIIRCFLFFEYTITLLRIRRNTTYNLGYLYYFLGIIFLTVVVTSFASGAIFSIDRKTGYVKGFLYELIYGALFFYLIAGLAYLIYYRDRLRKQEWISIISAHLLLIAGGICRFLFPSVLLMDSFFMLSILMLYLSFENADLYMENRTRTFNYQAFERVIEEKVAYGKKFWFAAVMARNYSETREIYGGVQMDQALGEIGAYLKRTFRKKVIFYERNGCFIIMDRHGRDPEKVRQRVFERFARHWQAYDTMVDIHLVYAQMDPKLKIQSAEQLGECLRKLFDSVTSGQELDLRKSVGEDSSENIITINQEMLDRIVSDFKDQKILKEAIAGKRILAYLQPLVDGKTNRIIAAEALARIEDKEMGVIPPFRFIPIAEKNGSIGILGEQVFERVCWFLREYGDELGLEFVNVNLSPIQCMNRELADRFEQLIQKYQVDPKRIHLEITEESLVDTKILRWQMERLISRGFSFALDDFGSGYANQFKVKEYPFSGVKLDMSIVRDHFKNPDRMLPDSVDVFLDRGLNITAEGIETREMAEGMKEMGVTYLQGYYYSKPLPIAEFVKYVKNYRA